jgi:hypothetical protein
MLGQRSRRAEAKLFASVALLGSLIACGGGDAADEAAADSTAEAPAAGPATISGTMLTADQLKTSAQTYVGQTVNVVNMAVAQPVGTEAFFLDVPEVPFLVKLPAGTPVPATGAHVTVVGVMKAMNDSIMNDWITRKLVPEADKILIEFSTNYIEAQSVQSQP